MVPRTRTVSCADAGNAMQIKAKLAAASVRCIMPDIVFLPGFELTVEFSPGWTGLFPQMLVEEAVFVGASKNGATTRALRMLPLQPQPSANIPGVANLGSPPPA